MTILEARCINCEQEWDIDSEPVACICEDGGRWQLRVDGSTWGEPVDRDGNHGLPG
jgi:hypothetical protein